MEEEGLEETPKKKKKEKPAPTPWAPAVVFVKAGEVEYEGGCWCGKSTGTEGCTGGPVKVGAWKHLANFTCPRKRPVLDTVPAMLKGIAKAAGLVE